MGYVFSYSFMLTDKIGAAAEIERWHRQRAHIEERVKENGCRLLHLPMREAAADRAWQAATVVSHNLIAMLAVEVAAANRLRLRKTRRRRGRGGRSPSRRTRTLRHLPAYGRTQALLAAYPTVPVPSRHALRCASPRRRPYSRFQV